MMFLELIKYTYKACEIRSKRFTGHKNRYVLKCPIYQSETQNDQFLVP